MFLTKSVNKHTHKGVALPGVDTCRRPSGSPSRPRPISSVGPDVNCSHESSNLPLSATAEASGQGQFDSHTPDLVCSRRQA